MMPGSICRLNMKRLKHLNPASILITLEAIDAEPPSHTLERRSALRRVMVVLACVCVCLLLVHYGKYSRNLLLILHWLGGHSGQDYIGSLRASGWFELAGYAWWSGVHLLGYVVIPALIIRLILKERLADMGWRWGKPTATGRAMCCWPARFCFLCIW